MLETFTCSHCGNERPFAERTIFAGQELCRACCGSETCVCDRCGERIWREDDCGDATRFLCQNCMDRYYDRCTGCGCLVDRDDLHFLDEDDTDGYCLSCYEQRIREAGIHPHHYKPEPVFHGSGHRYLGVELEVDGGGENNENAFQIQQAGNAGRDHIYIKHDGSLDAGLEIVTHPMTLEYHQNEMPWREVMKTALSLGYTSHQARTCGLHVHVNRDSLGAGRKEQEDTIARILFLVETFWNELLKFSRRSQLRMDQWASRYGRKDDPKDVLHSAKCRADRYTCVNLTPRDTIEFRMFRGTLKYNTLIATLQLVERLCGVAFDVSDDDVKRFTWSEFVSGIHKDTMPELVQYLKERRLYVNAPVPVTEEV